MFCIFRVFCIFSILLFFQKKGLPNGVLTIRSRIGRVIAGPRELPGKKKCAYAPMPMPMPMHDRRPPPTPWEKRYAYAPKPMPMHMHDRRPLPTPWGKKYAYASMPMHLCPRLCQISTISKISKKSKFSQTNSKHSYIFQNPKFSNFFQSLPKKIRTLPKQIQTNHKFTTIYNVSKTNSKHFKNKIKTYIFL